MECLKIPARIIATCFALAAFAAATAVGLAAGNSTMTILTRAMVALVVCWFVGRIVGHFAQKAVQDHIERYKQENPIPTDEMEPTTASPNSTPEENTTT